MSAATMGKVEEAFGELPGWLKDATKGKVVVEVADRGDKTVTLEDVIRYYATDARDITSGCRTLGPIVGDWRPIDNLAQECLGIFKVSNIEGLRREGKKRGMMPRF